MRKLLPMLLFWVAALAPTQAQETVTLNDLVVWTHDGAKNVFELKNDPRVVFEEGALVVRAADGTEFRFAVSDLLRWTYQQRTVDGIDDASADKTHPFMEGDHLVISQLKEGTTVRVYATDGRQVLQRQMKRDGACCIPLQKLPTGVYVVQVNTLTYKILKK